MLTHPTLDLLHQLGLNGMAKAFAEIEATAEATALTHPEWLALLLDQEVSYRRDRRLLARLRYASHDTRALQHYLGHKNIQHTVRYTEMAPDRFKDFWRG